MRRTNDRGIPRVARDVLLNLIADNLVRIQRLVTLRGRSLLSPSL